MFASLSKTLPFARTPLSASACTDCSAYLAFRNGFPVAENGNADTSSTMTVTPGGLQCCGPLCLAPPVSGPTGPVLNSPCQDFLLWLSRCQRIPQNQEHLCALKMLRQGSASLMLLREDNGGPWHLPETSVTPAGTPKPTWWSALRLCDGFFRQRNSSAESCSRSHDQDGDRKIS